MTFHRILRPAGSPPDPDAAEPEPEPRWLAAARTALGEAVAAAGGRGPTVESCVTLGALLAAVESEGLPPPLVLDEPDGSVLARFDGPEGRAVTVAARGRSAVVSAWVDHRATTAAILVRDARGYVVPGVPAPSGELARLRVALAWAAGDLGVTRSEMMRVAGAGRKAI